MAMSREDALQYIRTYAQTKQDPALTDLEEQQVLNACRIRDRNGIAPTEEGYEETIWATRAVKVALDTRVLMATHMVDFTADGSTVAQSQIVANLQAAAAKAAAHCIGGSV